MGMTTRALFKACGCVTDTSVVQRRDWGGISIIISNIWQKRKGRFQPWSGEQIFQHTKPRDACSHELKKCDKPFIQLGNKLHHCLHNSIYGTHDTRLYLKQENTEFQYFRDWYPTLRLFCTSNRSDDVKMIPVRGWIVSWRAKSTWAYQQRLLSIGNQIGFAVCLLEKLQS